MQKLTITNKEKNEILSLSSLRGAQDVEKISENIFKKKHPNGSCGFWNKDNELYSDWLKFENIEWFIKDEVLLLTGIGGKGYCFLNTKLIKISGWFKDKERLNNNDTLWILQRSDGYRCFINIKTMKASDFILFDKYETLGDGRFRLISKFGPTTIIDTEDMIIPSWQFPEPK